METISAEQYRAMTAPMKRQYRKVALERAYAKKIPHPKSLGEETLAMQLDAYKIPFEREWKFCERKWRFDFAFPDKKIAVEIEGGIFTHGRHTRPLGYIADMDKYNNAALAGFKVLRFTSGQVTSGAAIGCILGALE